MQPLDHHSSVEYNGRMGDLIKEYYCSGLRRVKRVVVLVDKVVTSKVRRAALIFPFLFTFQKQNPILPKDTVDADENRGYV